MSVATLSVRKNIDSKYTISNGVLTHVGSITEDSVRHDYIRVLFSVQTVGFKRKELVREKWIPKNPKVLALQPPRKPKFNPPRLWPLREIKLKTIDPAWSEKTKQKVKRRNNLISQDYQRYVGRYILRRIEINRKRRDYLKTYKNRMIKFEMYSAYYDSIQRKLKEGILRVKRVRFADKGLPDHPLTDNQLWAKDGLVKQFGFVKYDSVLWTLDRFGWKNTEFNFDLRMLYFNTYLTEVTNRLNAKTTRKLVQKLGNQDLHIANIVGERAQTIRMLGETFKRLKSLVTAKGLAKTSARNLGLIGANATLEFNFGWKPLLHDIFALYQLLGKLNSDPETSTDVVVIRSNSSEEIRYTVPCPFVKVIGPVYEPDADGENLPLSSMTFDNLDLRGHHNVSYVLRYKVKNPALYQLQQLGLVNPLEVAWELLPWSFVVDWVLSVGNSINSMSAQAGLEFINGTRTETTFYELDYKGYAGNRAQPVTTAVPDGYYVDIENQSIVRNKKRTLLTSSPISNVLPSFKNPISTIHGVEGLALFLQRLLK